MNPFLSKLICIINVERNTEICKCGEIKREKSKEKIIQKYINLKINKLNEKVKKQGNQYKNKYRNQLKQKNPFMSHFIT